MSTRKAVSKENFVSIYARAHKKTLTTETAFRKTGVYPLNPSVITTQMMAPSLETLCDAEGCLPLSLPSPVCIMSSVVRQYQQLQEADVNNASDLIAGPSHSRTTLAWHAVAKEAVSELASTSAAFLVDETPINSAHKVPSYFPPPLTPT